MPWNCSFRLRLCGKARLRISHGFRLVAVFISPDTVDPVGAIYLESPMFKRLYKRFLSWALAPVLEPLRVDERQVINSIRAASARPKAIVANSGAWTLDPKGALSLRTKP